MKPDNFFARLVAAIVILLCIELSVNFVLSTQAKSEFVEISQPQANSTEEASDKSE